MEDKHSKVYDCPSILPLEYFQAAMQGTGSQAKFESLLDFEKTELKIWEDQGNLGLQDRVPKRKRPTQKKNHADLELVSSSVQLSANPTYVC